MAFFCRTSFTDVLSFALPTFPTLVSFYGAFVLLRYYLGIIQGVAASDATKLLFFEMYVFYILLIFASYYKRYCLFMKRATFILLLFLTQCFLSTLGYALNNYYFNVIGRDKGLSQTDVKAIIQDSNGFMWFGTRNKLNRYDGNSFKIFDCYDAVAQKRNNNISALFEDKEKVFWVGTDKGVFFLNPQTGVFTYMDTKTQDGTGIHDWISDIKEDRDGNVWIVTPNQGLFRYRKDTKELKMYEFGIKSVPDHGNPQSICIDQGNRVWIGTNGKGVYQYNKDTDEFIQYLGDALDNTLEGENIYTMCDDGDFLLLGIHEGKLRRINKRRNDVTDVNVPEVHYKIIRCVAKLNNKLWVGTDWGIYVIDEEKGDIFRIHHDPMSSYSLSDNLVAKIYQDRENGIWIGTGSGGINYLSNSVLKFTRYIPSTQKESISSKRVREIVEDANQRIWVGTEDAGVNIFSPESQRFKKPGRDIGEELTSEQTLGLLPMNGDVWVGLFKKGLDIVSTKNYKLRNYTGKQLDLNESSIYTLCEDRYGNIWLGNGWGVYVGNKETMTFENIPDFDLCFIFDIIEDTDGVIWIATMGNGVFKYSPRTRKIEHYTNQIDDPYSISSNSVSSITETSTGDIWFATDRGGVCRYNSNENNFRRISVAEGLPDDCAYKIVEDKNGYLWFGTNDGLVQMNPQDFSIKIYSTSTGLPSSQFNYKSALASSTGELFFGTSEGLISFFPERMEQNNFIPPVYITTVRYKNAVARDGEPINGVEGGYFKSQQIELRHDQNSLELSFVALSYACPTANQYAYKLDNLDKDWIYTKGVQSVNYANLSPGQYKFIVKASNNDNVWNEEGASISITILPPWWMSNVAKACYLILIFLGAYLLAKYYTRVSNKKTREEQRLFESEKEKELYSSKIDFFTNIAHEIRTPLTLINGPIESLVEMDIKEPEIKKNIQLMQRNISELLNLINQILDFRKIDANKVAMNLVVCNVSGIVNEVYQEFLPLFSSVGKNVTIDIPEQGIYAMLDRNSFVKILNNLFSNAVRYSDSNIHVALEENDEHFCLTIKNDGEIVPQDMAEKIFDPFYQLKKNSNINASTGIGLSLARSLTELHHGTLKYNSVDGNNVFVLDIPKGEVTHNQKITDPYDDELMDMQPKQETILLVEDNLELLSFMAEKLSTTFTVEKATNGAEAFDIIERKSVDIVITDIMMPVMNGFDFCKKIKTDIEYCHIPIVLLTAKNDLNSKIKGLETGADAYIEKPFSFKYLITQINSLLENRKREKEAFIRKPYVTSQSIGLCKADEEFINRMISIIEENITDSNFGVERMSEITNMSRSSLHRKIKALSGTSPTDFIRLIRLKKASGLIAEGRYRTGEVCYVVGINSPSYFIKLFQKQFGMTPKEFEKQQRMSNTNEYTIK